MKRFPLGSLRACLIFLVLLSVLPALGLTLYLGLEQRRITATQVKDEALKLAQLMSNSHGQIIESTRQLLYMIAQLPQVRNTEPASSCSLFADLLHQHPQYLNIGAADSEGNIFASAVPLAKPINISDRHYFKQALKTRKFSIGHYQIGRIHGKPSINFGYPVFSAEGKVNVIVFASLDLNWINQLVSQAALPNNSTITVIDQGGMILAHYPDPEKFVGKTIQQVSIGADILTKREGVEEALSLEGMPSLFGFASFGSPSGSVYVCIGIPKQVAYAEVYRNTIRNLIWLGVVAVLAFAAAWFIGGVFIMRPVNRLMSVTKRLAEGDLAARVESPSGPREISQLAHAFDQMAESIQHRENERKQAEEALKGSEKAAKQLAQENAAMAEIGRVVSSTLNIEEVYDRFAEEVRNLIHFDRIAININNYENNTITIAYVAGMDIADRRIGDVVTLSGSVNAEVARIRSSLLVQTEDKKELTDHFPTLLTTFRAGLRSMLSVPLVSKDQVIGVLHFRSLKANAYTETHVRLAERVGNQIAGAIANAQLFTERKRAGEALRTEKQRFQTLTENAPFGMVMIDQDGTFRYMNPKFKELFGYDLTDVPNGRTWFRKAYPDPTYRHRVIETWLKDLESIKPGEKRPEVFTVTCKDGTEKTINFIPVQLEKGENLMACEDITGLKRAEEEKAALEEQLRQSQRMEAIGQLAGGVAHDFNNLMTVIRGYSQLSLLELKEGDPLRGNLEEIQKATERASDLTCQLLAFSRRQIMDMKVFDLNNLIQDLDKMLRRVIGEDIELITLLAKDPSRVKTDPGQIEQVILNLAVNARDAMPHGGKLVIETKSVRLDEEYASTHIGVTPGPYMMLALSDTGTGIAPEVKEHLFEPFFTTKEVGKGTGLGLSTVYGIVKQSGGNIWVYSEQGKGSTFKIYLPQVDEPIQESTEAILGEVIPRGDEAILVVEDEEKVRKLAAQILKAQGYTVFEASHGEEAMKVAQAHAARGIHLLLTDVVMPGMNGCELAKTLRVLIPKMKVLYMSGYPDNAIVHRGILEEGTNYIQKPFTLDSVARKVREALDR